MKAHFIRGENPKDAMNIGNQFIRIRDRMEQGVRIICRDYSLDLKTIHSKIEESGILVEFDGLKPNLVHPYRYFIYYDIEREHYWVGYININDNKIEDQKPATSLEKAMLETRIYLNKFNWTAKPIPPLGVNESVNFERGIEPIDAMKIGDVSGRKFKKIHKELSETINKLAVEWWGDKEILSHTDNPYMKIVDNSSPKEHWTTEGYVEIGVERIEGSSKYYYYLVWSDEFAYGAGYTIDHKKSPDSKETEKDEIPYDTLEEAINKLTWWYKNL